MNFSEIKGIKNNNNYNNYSRLKEESEVTAFIFAHWHVVARTTHY